MKKKGIKKYLLGIGSAAAGGAAGASARAAGATAAGASGTAAGAGSAGASMGGYGDKIMGVAGSLMPLLMKKPDPNALPYKKGSKLIKYQDGVDTLRGKNGAPDTLRSKTTGAKTSVVFGNDDEEEKEKKVEKKVEKKQPEKTKATKSKENKGLYQGNKAAEYSVSAGLPALGELISSNPTTKIGRKLAGLSKLLKYGPATARTIYDTAGDIVNKGSVDVWARLGNALKDAGIATGVTTATRGIPKTAKKYKAQVTAAAKNTVDPVAPSRQKALKEGMTESVKESSANKLITYTKEVVTGGPQSKKASLNIKNAEARKNANNYTGQGNGKKGVEGEYYIKGKVVDEKTYKETTAKRKEEAEKLQKTRQKSKEGPSDYEKELEQVDPEFRNKNYVAQKQKDFEVKYHAERKAAGAKDYSEDIKNFREDYVKKQNTINTQPKPQGMSDEDFAKKKTTELEAHKQTKVAFDKALEERKTKGTTTETKKPVAKPAEKPVTKTETSSRVKRQPVSTQNKAKDADAKRETKTTGSNTGSKSNSSKSNSNKGNTGNKGASNKNTRSNKPATGSGKKSNSPTGERKEFSGRMPPGMIPGMPAGAKKKANGARLIKYK